MWKVERLVEGAWIEASSHTLEVDAQRQVTLFVTAEIPAEELRIVAPE